MTPDLNDPATVPTLLVVDDDEIDRTNIRRALAAAGYESVIHEAERWRDGADALLESEFDCVLLDYNLPDGTGADFLAWMRKAGVDVPTLVLTGQTDEEIAAGLIGAGARGYVSKRRLNGPDLVARLDKILETHASQRALERTRERLDIAVVSSGIGIWEYDPRTGQARCDVAGCHMMGLSPDVDTPLEDFVGRVCPNDRARVRAMIEKASENPDSPRLCEEFLTEIDPEGRVRWIELNAQPVVRGRKDARRVVRVVGTAADITNRRREADRLRFLAQAGAVLSTGFDAGETLDRIASLAVPSWADFCLITAYGEGDEPTWTGCAHVPGFDEASERDILAWMEREGEELWDGHGQGERPGSYLLPAITSPASLGPLASGAPLLTSAGVVSLISVALPADGRAGGGILLLSTHPELRYSDGELLITEELARRLSTKLESVRMYQTAERERAQAEAALKDRDYLLQVISHDLRDPIGTIMGAAQLLEMGILTPDQIAVQGAVIRRVGSRMGELVEGLLDVSRMEAGQFRVEMHAVDLSAVLAESAEQLRPAVERAGGSLHLQIPSGLPDVLGDQPRLQQVLANLVGNALKHAGDQPGITIRATVQAREVQISVQDTGPGIDPGKKSMLFERFWQDEGAKGGAGLGLAIVKGIVEAHGGRIWVESTPAIGSIFTFSLPMVAGEAIEADAPARGTPA